MLRAFHCSKSALRLSTTWRKRHAVLHISNSDSICLQNMCCADTVGTVFRSVAFAQKCVIFSNITFERPWNVCTGLPACFVPKSNGNCRFHKKSVRFLKNRQVFPKNVSCNMKCYASSVSLFKICASIINNLRKRARRALYFRQRFHLFT